jgi:NitT/TauT family transport system substrate-binding protein
MIARRVFGRGLLGMAALMAAWAGSFPARAQTSVEKLASMEKFTLMTDWSPYGVHGPLFLAAQKGWFNEAGIDLAIRDGKGSTSTVQLVGTGTVDIGFVQLSSMAAALDAGMAVTSIACFIRAGDNGVIVPVESAIKVPQDLLGKRIAYPLGGASSSLMEAFFTVAKLPRDQMKLVGVDSSALASTYASGNADAAIATIAYLTPQVDAIRPSRTIAYSSVGLVVPSFGLAVRNADVATRGAAFAKLVPVMLRAWEYVRDGHVDEAIDAIVAQRPNDKLDRTVMKNQLIGYLKLLDTPATAGKPIGWQAESDWAAANATLHAAGLLKHDHQPADFFTNQFIATR